jgi:hypothetical protein
MKSILFLSTIILIIFILYSCEETTQPIVSNELNLVLKADKTSGSAPLTVNFSAEINGDTTGLVGFVPDYFFFPGHGRTIIRYALPDTLQKIRVWADQETYIAPGTIKAVLLYQGKKNNAPFDLWSDTLIINVQ